jgi:hypothetical protein
VKPVEVSWVVLNDAGERNIPLHLFDFDGTKQADDKPRGPECDNILREEPIGHLEAEAEREHRQQKYQYVPLQREELPECV